MKFARDEEPVLLLNQPQTRAIPSTSCYSLFMQVSDMRKV